ncbi:MAG: sugar phosphate isomerase/epimerase [Ruminococcaceae bacterium]|nr:sugar phosphate isomerase/epimerase [Oscillospiraceae bacterium]
MNVGYLIHLENDPYEQIREAAALGFRYGQLSVWDMAYHTEESAERILAACRDFSFTVTAVWCGWSGTADWRYPGMYRTLGLVPDDLREVRVKDILGGAALAARLGVKDIITHIGYLPDDPLNETRMAVVRAARHICEQISKNGQYFLFETGEMIPTTLIQFMTEIGLPNVGVNLDPANFVINGRANPTDAARRLAPYIRGMHAKDALPPVGTAPKGREVKHGEGVVDFAQIFSVLKAAGYGGSVTIEYEMKNTPDRREELLSSKAYLENLISSL